MATEARRRPGGARPNGPLLEREQIVDEAVALTAEVGLDGLSMRQLGERLGVTSMAIYWYVRNRGELVDAVADRVALSIVDPPSDAPCDEWLRALSLSIHDVFSGYAGVPDHILGSTEIPAALAAHVSAAVDRLIEAGTDAADALVAVSVLGTFVLARAQIDAHHRASGAEPMVPGLDTDDILRKGIDTILDGLGLNR